MRIGTYHAKVTHRKNDPAHYCLMPVIVSFDIKSNWRLIPFSDIRLQSLLKLQVVGGRAKNINN